MPPLCCGRLSGLLGLRVLLCCLNRRHRLPQRLGGLALGIHVHVGVDAYGDSAGSMSRENLHDLGMDARPRERCASRCARKASVSGSARLPAAVLVSLRLWKLSKLWLMLRVMEPRSRSPPGHGGFLSVGGVCRHLGVCCNAYGLMRCNCANISDICHIGRVSNATTRCPTMAQPSQPAGLLSSAKLLLSRYLVAAVWRKWSAMKDAGCALRPVLDDAVR